MRTYQWVSPRKLAFSALQGDAFLYGRLCLDTGKIEEECHKFSNLEWFSADSQCYTFIGATEKNFSQVIYGHWGTPPQRIPHPNEPVIPEEKLSLPIPIQCPHQGLMIEGFYYPPTGNRKVNKKKSDEYVIGINEGVSSGYIHTSVNVSLGFIDNIGCVRSWFNMCNHFNRGYAYA